MTKDFICRTCLTRTEKCISIYKEPELWGKTIPLSKMIMACAPINVLPEDEFPSHICDSCLKQLQFSFLFRMRILQADAQLKACKKRQIKLDGYSEDSTYSPYFVQLSNESVYSMKEILYSSEHKDKHAPEDTLAIDSSVKSCRNNEPMPEINVLLNPIEEVNVPMVSDLFYEETIDTKVLPSVKDSRVQPKTIGEVDLTDDKTDIVTSIEIPEPQSENSQNISNNVIVHPLQIANQLILPSNFNFCVSDNGANSYFVPNSKEHMAQFQHSPNNLIQLQDSDKSILQNLLQTQNNKQNDNHYIVIAGNGGGQHYLVAANQTNEQQNNDQHYSTNDRSSSPLNQQSCSFARQLYNRGEVAVAPHKNQPNTLNQINSTQQQPAVKSYEKNYYNFLNDEEKRKVNDLLAGKRSNSKRNSTDSDCVDLTSDVEDNFTNASDSILKITNVSSQATKKICLTKK